MDPEALARLGAPRYRVIKVYEVLFLVVEHTDDVFRLLADLAALHTSR